MIDSEHCRVMADYNAWMNSRLYALCADMTDEERKQDRGAFFGSIHRTLNHILYGDLAFLSRLTGDPAEVPALQGELHSDFGDLRQARETVDARLSDWSATLSQEWLAGDLTFLSKVDNATRTIPRWVTLTHMFNHQTHHRGQITTLLSQMGLDIGPTDIPFMPQFQPA
jgi:uncharacterized damage-inducible protein DinB